ncbi:MAG: hypothetical protein KKG76_06785 [Euryarchaeota archaeon]|nr:hypothetical protein [Euryarchaeota archaeon]
MKSALIVTVFLIIVFASLTPFSVGASEKRSIDITSLTINFDKTDATFTVYYDIGRLPKMFILLLGSKSLEPKIKSVFFEFDYDIIKMDPDKAVLRVKNISRPQKEYYLHDSVKFGESIKTVLYIYTPDSPDPKKYSRVYLFDWSNIPGNDNDKLLKFLKNDLEINWVKNAKITKLDDDKVIRIFSENNSIDIVLENEQNAIIKLTSGKTYDLQVDTDRGKYYIYSPLLYSTPDIVYRS